MLQVEFFYLEITSSIFSELCKILAPDIVHLKSQQVVMVTVAAVVGFSAAMSRRDAFLLQGLVSSLE